MMMRTSSLPCATGTKRPSLTWSIVTTLRWSGSPDCTSATQPRKTWPRRPGWDSCAVSRGSRAAPRQVVTLRDIQGFSSDEVCGLLHLTDANQRVLLHRGRSKVRAALEAYCAAEV